MRAVTNILLFIGGVAGSGAIAFFTATIMVRSAPCFEGACGFATLFLTFPLMWFVLFSLFIMAMLIWRRKPRRDHET